MMKMEMKSMEKNEKSMDTHYLENEQNKNNQKGYTSPSLIVLGKMQKVTLGKGASDLDGATLDGDDLAP